MGTANVAVAGPSALRRRAGGRRLAPRLELTAQIHAAAIDAVLATSPFRLNETAEEPITADALAAASWEIAHLERSTVSASTSLFAELLRIHDAAIASLGNTYYLPFEAHSAAMDNLDALGDVIVCCPTPRTRQDKELVGALAARGTVIEAPKPEFGTQVIHASDADDEVRAVARLVRGHLTDGTPAHRIGLHYGSREPYLRLLHEHLAAAGVVVNGPAAEGLADRPVARALRTLLSFDPDDIPRRELLDVMSERALTSPPLADGVMGQPLIERLTRNRVPIVRGDDWERLAPGRVEGSHATAAEALHAWVTKLRRHLRDIHEAANWTEVSNALAGLIDAMFRPPADELAARDLEAIRSVIADLTQIEGIAPAPTADRIADAVNRRIRSHVGRVGTRGVGVSIGPLSDGVGRDLDVSIIVGAAEGIMPARRAPNPLLPPEVTGITPADDIAYQRMVFERTLAAGAHHRVITFPRDSLGGGAERVPSRWLLRTLEHLAGSPVGIVSWGEDTRGADSIIGVESFYAPVQLVDPWPGAGAASATEWRQRALAVVPARERRGVLDDPVITVGMAMRSVLDDPDADPQIDPLPGDLEQSIYRFRRADYVTARETTPPTDIVSLTTNVRSTVPVISWVNQVFGALIADEPRIQPEYQPFDAAPGRPHWDPADGPGAFVFVDTAAVTEDEANLSSSELARTREARDVAQIIYTAVNRGWRKEVRADDGYAHDPIALRDICILIPSRTVLPYLERSLADAGIEFRCEASSLVYSTQEAHDLLLTARALANTADEAALVGALRTPLFGCGDDDLLRWKAAGGRWHWYGDPPAGQEDSPVAAGLFYLREVWSKLGQLTPGRLLSRLAVDRRVFEVSMDSPRHRDVWRRLRFVVDQAHAWYEEDRGSLREYLDWAAARQEETARVAEAVLPEIGVNAVRIMTIHAAKGLQFPMVVLAGMSGGVRRAAEALIVDDDGVVHSHKSKGAKSVDYETASAWQKQHATAVRIRLLYVACTRAESQLAVSGYGATRDSWGAVLQPGLDAVVDPVTPELGDVVRLEEPVVERSTVGETWDEWLAKTALVEENSSKVSLMSVPSIVHGAAAAHTAVKGGYAVPARPGDEVLPSATAAVDHGEEVGTALHAVLDTIGLVEPDDPSVAEFAEAIGRRAGVTDIESFTAMVRSTLACEVVRRAAATEHWTEMPLYGMAPDGETAIEGIADLVYRDGDDLVIADYKTDLGVTAATVDAYFTQLGIYASLLSKATGERVSRVESIFCRSFSAYVIARAIL
ncbi:3'-5' exonuclease [Williamsia sp. CHRR-6]|uniref:3'-5' exonuclease n=1 Tax=Williamsia sp. CHRR-6 TaxID=2835871 RepID=UPI001BDB400E|nr:3'-5' exonuclease [Williamsia sp. CHRR-6]MBT0566076.1 PD-(D/E)XK nuclease family protein [Williamsia sp. CHRR-6]